MAGIERLVKLLTGGDDEKVDTEEIQKLLNEADKGSYLKKLILLVRNIFGLSSHNGLRFSSGLLWYDSKYKMLRQFRSDSATTYSFVGRF